MKMATKWGIVSAGKICHDFVTAVHTLPAGEHEIVAVAARKIEDAQKFAKLHNISKAYGSYEELAKDSDVEVAYIGTINIVHYSVGKLMLESGKHVLMEKPMGLNLREVKELTSLAKKKQLFLMEALWSRFLPSYEYLMREIKSGAIGKVFNVNVNFGFNLTEVERLQYKNLGGGALLDLGIYCVNAICMVYEGNHPQQIKAVGHLNEEGVDESLAVALQYSDGRLAVMNTSMRVDLPSELSITGTGGQIKLPFPMWCADKVINKGETKDFPLPSLDKSYNFVNSLGLRYQAVEVRRCLKEGLLESPRMSHAESELFFTIMDEIRRQVGVVYSVDNV